MTLSFLLSSRLRRPLFRFIAPARTTRPLKRHCLSSTTHHVHQASGGAHVHFYQRRYRSGTRQTQPKSKSTYRIIGFFPRKKRWKGESRKLMCDGGRIDMNMRIAFFALGFQLNCSYVPCSPGMERAFLGDVERLAYGAFGLRWHWFWLLCNEYYC